MVPISPMQCFATVKEKSQSASVNLNQKIVRYTFRIRNTRHQKPRSHENRVCVLCVIYETMQHVTGLVKKMTFYDVIVVQSKYLEINIAVVGWGKGGVYGNKRGGHYER